jgi:lipopolysaccharide transport system permease protein
VRDAVEHLTASDPPTSDVRGLSSTESSPSHELPRVVIDGSSNWARWWADIVAYRGALYSLALRNFRSRYKQAALGIAWAVLQPLLQVAVFTVVFSRIAGADPGGIPYPVFALAGLIPWNVLAKIVTDGSTSLAVNQHIITKLFFPRIYLVISAGTSAVVDAIVGVALLGGLMALYGIPPAKTVLLALPALGAVMLLGFGLAALLAAVNARWRDVQHTIPFLLQIGLLATPIVYPPTVVSERWQWLLALNPVTALVAAFRSAVLGSPLPPGRMMAGSLAVSLGAVVVGLWYFTRAERTIVDVV